MLGTAVHAPRVHEQLSVCNNGLPSRRWHMWAQAAVSAQELRAAPQLSVSCQSCKRAASLRC